MGPTGAGKSEFALRLAAQLPIEIISVDSAQVYRGMDIGTAKPSVDERVRVAHHLLDLRDPTQSYSAGEFVVDARIALREILARGRIPLLVGGTMLYFRALLGGMAVLPRASSAVRTALDARAAREGWPALHAELARVDPGAAARIHPNDPRRIQRALEVHAVTGRPISDLWAVRESPDQAAPEFGFASWALVPGSRPMLHARLEQRFNAMMQLGFLDEVRALHARGDLCMTNTSMRAVGYRQLWAHVAGEVTLEQASVQAVAATRQLAKRQLTWLRSWPAVQRIDPFSTDSFEHFRAAVLQLLQ
ncbi:MAG: tRNA (adenosine(37)-N6)-dimethylallyltransferase MiaA [Steroidobacteraceae bacterium]